MDLDSLNVRTFFEEAVAAHADEPYLIWTVDGAQWTYAEADDRINRAAHVWYSLGVRKGDRVAFMLDNSPDFIWAWLGLAKLGGILVAINTGFRRAEAGFLVADSLARVALVGADYLPIFDDIRATVPTLERAFTIGAHPAVDDFVELMDAAAPLAPPADLGGDDVISLIYTSGTTGNPKGVMQTHRNFVLTGQAYGYWMQMSQGQRIYACLPLFHINSQTYSCMGAIGVGGAMVLAPRFSASRFWPDVRTHRVNVFNFIGAMTVILSKKEPAPDDADNSVHIAYGVPALAPEIVGDIEKRFGLKVISGFGMSETTFGLLEPLDQPRRPGSMGIPRHHPDPSVPRTEAKIVDEDGNEVARGVTGELLLRNAAMMSGYFGSPERTAEALVDGWLHTGDSANQDDDGFFFFVDRKKDIVRRRGENVSSLEVERVIERHPAVLAAAVIGVPSDLTDEELMTFVVRRPDAEVSAEQIFDWAEENLASFKVPRYVEFVDSLPKTPTEKIQKAKLREFDAAQPHSRIERGPRSVR